LKLLSVIFYLKSHFKISFLKRKIFIEDFKNLKKKIVY
jgi:hypothetical protein